MATQTHSSSVEQTMMEEPTVAAGLAGVEPETARLHGSADELVDGPWLDAPLDRVDERLLHCGVVGMVRGPGLSSLARLQRRGLSPVGGRKDARPRPPWFSPFQPNAGQARRTLNPCLRVAHAGRGSITWCGSDDWLGTVRSWLQ